MINVKDFVKGCDKKPIAVLGLGLTGKSAALALQKAGAEVIVWDDNPERANEMQDSGFTVRSLDRDVLDGCAALVLAPGIPLHYPAPHRAVIAARAAGCEILSDIEILHRCNHGRKTIGLTGTNGKSTTTALIDHILNTCGLPSALGGNIGKPVLGLKMPPKDGVFVFELSSFQIDLCPTFRPDIAVLLNITPDHIDRHGSMDKYVVAKEHLFEGPGVAIIGVDDSYTQKTFDRVREGGQRRMIPISNTRSVEWGVYVENGHIFDAMDGPAIEVGSLNFMTALHGLHNHQNAAAAYAVARHLNLKPDQILQAMKTFQGLPHRQKVVRVINGVAYMNDSKATNAEAAGKALTCHNNIYWILGGRAKEDKLDGLEIFAERIRHAFLIGEAAHDFAKWFDEYEIPYENSISMDVAVLSAHRHAQADRGLPGGNGIVMLSPACASFDQYKSFEERGDHFTRLVETLEEES